ncbi:SprT family zinc-dependent metalloprotease [Shimia sp.]|uniref:M48 family metallopeptidase n=1 Tax=Shimia sp. TaxID=1954381 RepID=UPI003298928B
MTQHILSGEPPLTVFLRKSARARRISLRVSRLDGKVTLTVPNGVSEREALAFAQEKQSWLRAQQDKSPTSVIVCPGTALPVAGRMRTIVPGKGRRVVLGDDTLAVPGTEPRIGARAQGFLKELARHRLCEAVEHYEQTLGRAHSRLTLRDTRSRWGSCSSAKALMFSWRLIMAPPAVLDYVAAHEVAHLVEMNHAPAFWTLVERIHGPYDAQRRWLRDHGQDLHKYRFTQTDKPD